MKIRRRALIVVLCVLLVFSFSAVVYASASKIFFTKTLSGYSCTGQGKIVDNVATAYFKGTPKLMEPIIPHEACKTRVDVSVFGDNGKFIGHADTNNPSSTTASASYTATKHIYYIECSFTFNGSRFDGYKLFNN